MNVYRVSMVYVHGLSIHLSAYDYTQIEDHNLVSVFLNEISTNPWAFNIGCKEIV